MSLYFSIIIPTYNSEMSLSKAIKSILTQTYNDFEIIIIDGFSTDRTLEIANSFHDERIKIVSEKDKGIYDAMNKGIKKAKGDWLYFMGSDDYLIDETVLSEMNSVINKKINADLIYGNVIWGKSQKLYDGPFNFAKLFDRNICHQAIFTKKNILEDLGCFNTKYPVLADYDMNLKIFPYKKYSIHYIDRVIAYFEVGGSSSTMADPFYNEKEKIKLNMIKSFSYIDRIYLKYVSVLEPTGKKMLIKKYFYQTLINLLFLLRFKTNYRFFNLK